MTRKNIKDLTLPEYYRMLDDHDWYYERMDGDLRKFNECRENFDYLKEVAKERKGKFAQLFEDFKRYNLGMVEEMGKPEGVRE